MTLESVRLSDDKTFKVISGLWKGRRGPLVQATVLRSTNFRGDGLLDYHDMAVLDVEESQLDVRRLETGDIVIERSGGGPKQPVGRAAIFRQPTDGNFAASNFTSVLRVVDRDAFDPEFVALYLLDRYLAGDTAHLQRATTGIRNLDWAEYLNTDVPRIDLQTQVAQAGVVRFVRQAYEAEGAVVDSLDGLKRTAMRELFTRGLRGAAQKDTEFGPVPADWSVLPLHDVADVQTGAAKGRRLDGGEVVEVPYLRVANVQDGHLDLSEIKKIRIRSTEVERYRLQVGDVVLTEGGDFDKLGRGFIWNGEIDLCVHQNHVFAVRPHPNRLLPEFFAYQSQSAYGKAYFLKVAHKTTNLACINSTKLKAFPALISPDLDEQREIVEILDAIDQKIDLHKRKKAVLEELFKALLHKLMTGEIRVSDLDLSALESGGK